MIITYEKYVSADKKICLLMKGKCLHAIFCAFENFMVYGYACDVSISILAFKF